MELKLEVNTRCVDKTAKLSDLDNPLGAGTVMMTPPIGEDYWLYRVEVSDRQAVIGFPKFGTIGIGFAVESDWNTNLPYTCSVEEIYDHIKHNRVVEGDKTIPDSRCIKAIKMIQGAVVTMKHHSLN